ncbi:AlbA family DNA-binding domain-containing protein [Sphingobium sp. DN12]|uniref:AlbA family DNA-binding domain-containing protein n=1 Tax=Sphingobium sp. DN12 TaxID=3378073 RepID=UPI003DA48949
MIERALDQITLADIEALVTYRRSEGATLDFKEAFPPGDHKGVRDFLADVTAFANTDGGDIIVGLREDKNGTAQEIVGIDKAGLDEGLRRIDDQLRSCIDPRVPLFRVQEIAWRGDKVVLIMRVGASLIAPHRVVYEKSSRFYRRANRGNFEMSTAEIRQAFAASADLPEKVRDLHHKAVVAIGGKDMPCRIHDRPTLIVTVAPLSVLRKARDVRITRDNAVMPPDPMGGIDWIVGLDGLIVIANREEQGARAWSVNHRRGYLDFAWAIGRLADGQKIIWPKYVVDHLPGAVRSTTTILRSVGVEGPWIVMASVTGLKDFRLIMSDHHWTDAAWQDSAYLGEIIDDAMSEDSLQPLVEGFWRLFGVENPPRPQR